MNTVGILGGVGPETTAEFYLELIFGCYKQDKVARPPIIIWNIPLEYKIEEELLTESKGEQRYLPYLIDGAKILERAGADFIVMPCNSLHIFIDEIRQAVNIPVLSIIEETARFLKNKSISEIGFLGTSSTVNNKIYETQLDKNDIRQVLPDGFDQAKIGRIINNIVLNRHANKDRDEFMGIVDRLSAEVGNIILACTDLQLLIPSRNDVEIYDTMKIFADVTVDKILEDN